VNPPYEFLLHFLYAGESRSTWCSSLFLSNESTSPENVPQKKTSDDFLYQQVDQNLKWDLQ